MAAKFDPNIELNPNPIMTAVVLFVLAGFATVFLIVKTGDPNANKADADAAAATP